MRLEDLGWDEQFAAAFATHSNWETFLVGLAASVDQSFHVLSLFIVAVVIGAA